MKQWPGKRPSGAWRRCEGQFAEGSMAPKIRAIVGYLDHPGRRGLITGPPNIGKALRGEAGTEIVSD